jgi:hypothetical protein
VRSPDRRRSRPPNNSRSEGVSERHAVCPRNSVPQTCPTGMKPFSCRRFPGSYEMAAPGRSRDDPWVKRGHGAKRRPAATLDQPDRRSRSPWDEPPFGGLVALPIIMLIRFDREKCPPGRRNQCRDHSRVKAPGTFGSKALARLLQMPHPVAQCCRIPAERHIRARAQRQAEAMYDRLRHVCWNIPTSCDPISRY